ncbi:MAG TPA: metal ABC transporter permease [Romboutsia timonensis]|uniref:Metal ABC transporter permease n=1 Tax=Romboutsia timonensis TaxID=1776391 RepID=A0A921MZG1_9FIRM|nr:metal ABC transporter permease [uncultured Romboutsia sp.]HJG95524.1 metal ABC transporter permease [Romboutsia timonensis]
MSLWYSIIDFLFPFEWVQYDFMKNALLGVLLVTPMFGILGTMVVNNKMAFFSDALGHSALTGIAVGVMFGINNTLISMLAFSILLTIAIINVKNAKTASVDTIIGVFSSSAVALGIVILSYNGGFNKYSVYLIGDLLSISNNDIFMLIISFIAVLLIWFTCFNKFLLVSINHTFARSRGVNVKFYEYIFTILVAIIVTISIQWVGILVISSMMILPAASARNISNNIREYHIYSISIAVISGILGLFLSYHFGCATGATIVLISSLFFAITYFISLRKIN